MTWSDLVFVASKHNCAVRGAAFGDFRELYVAAVNNISRPFDIEMPIPAQSQSAVGSFCHLSRTDNSRMSGTLIKKNVVTRVFPNLKSVD
jgi:hypothetical protein